MNIKIFLINLFFGCLALVFVFFNLFAFYSPFADPSDNNWPTIALDVLFAVGVCAYNVISAKKRGTNFRDIGLNRILPLAMPLIIAICLLIAERQINRNKPLALPKDENIEVKVFTK